VEVSPMMKKYVQLNIERRIKYYTRKYITVSHEIEWFGIITQHFIVVKFCMITKKDGILN